MNHSVSGWWFLTLSIYVLTFLPNMFFLGLKQDTFVPKYFQAVSSSVHCKLIFATTAGQNVSFWRNNLFVAVSINVRWHWSVSLSALITLPTRQQEKWSCPLFTSITFTFFLSPLYITHFHFLPVSSALSFSSRRAEFVHQGAQNF